MSTLTINFTGVYDSVLKDMVKSGMAKTKSEGVRMALLNFAMSTKMGNKSLLKSLQEEAKDVKISSRELDKLINDAKEANLS